MGEIGGGDFYACVGDGETEMSDRIAVAGTGGEGDRPLSGGVLTGVVEEFCEDAFEGAGIGLEGGQVAGDVDFKVLLLLGDAGLEGFGEVGHPDLKGNVDGVNGFWGRTEAG